MPDHPFSPGDCLVAYLRDSGHEQQELSIDRQTEELRAWCLKHHLVLAKLYIDAARPGSSDEHRPQLAQLMHDLRRGLDADGVIVWSSSRFARNSLDAQLYRAEIRKMGYIFHAITGQSFDGPEAIIFEAIEDYKNQRFLTDLSIDVKSGLANIVRNYGCVPGVPPVGFTRQQVIIGQHRDGRQRIAHRWVPDPLYTQRIRRAFEMRAAHASLGEINTETKLYTSINSYRTFFANKLYYGTLVFGDDVIIENYCEPIVERSLWDAVQAIQGNYARHKNMDTSSPQHPRRVNSQYLLSGLVHCARCGSPLFGRTHPQKSGKKTISYYCTRAYRERDCTKQRIPGEALEIAVIKALHETYLNPDYLEASYDEMRAINSAQVVEFAAQRRQHTRDLAELRRQITNLTDAIAQASASRALITRLSDLENQETELLSKIAAIDAQQVAEIPPVNRAVTLHIANNFANTFYKADTQNKRRILRGFIHRIDADRDGRRLFGSIAVYYPPEDLVKDLPPDEVDPPIGKPTIGGSKNVRKSHDPSGPPQFTHIFDFCFTIVNKAGKYKKDPLS